jgi:hypothetical protein
MEIEAGKTMETEAAGVVVSRIMEAGRGVV